MQLNLTLDKTVMMAMLGQEPEKEWWQSCASIVTQLIKSTQNDPRICCIPARPCSVLPEVQSNIHKIPDKFIPSPKHDDTTSKHDDKILRLHLEEIAKSAGFRLNSNLKNIIHLICCSGIISYKDFDTVSPLLETCLTMNSVRDYLISSFGFELKSPNDRSPNDRSPNDKSSNDKSSNDKSTNDKSTNDKSTNDKSTNDKSLNDDEKKREMCINMVKRLGLKINDSVNTIINFVVSNNLDVSQLDPIIYILQAYINTHPHAKTMLNCYGLEMEESMPDSNSASENKSNPDSKSTSDHKKESSLNDLTHTINSVCQNLLNRDSKYTSAHETESSLNDLTQTINNVCQNLFNTDNLSSRLNGVIGELTKELKTDESIKDPDNTDDKGKEEQN